MAGAQQLVLRRAPENGNWSHDDLSWRIAAPWTDLDRFVVLAAQPSDALLGGVWTKLAPGSSDGELYVVAVRPDRAGQGIGHVLLAQSLRVLARAGMTTASLYVDTTNTPALTLYRGAGFSSQHTDRCFEMNVTGYRDLDIAAGTRILRPTRRFSAGEILAEAGHRRLGDCPAR